MEARGEVHHGGRQRRQRRSDRAAAANWNRRRSGGSGNRSSANRQRSLQPNEVLRKVVANEFSLVLQEANWEKLESSQDPYVNEGFFYLEDDSVKFSFFKFMMLSPEVNASGEVLYPVMLLTNRSEMKRKAAVAKRTWHEWKEFEALLHGKFHYRYQEVSGINLGYFPPLYLPFLRAWAIRRFLGKLTQDSRMIGTNLFQSFMYTNVPLRLVRRTMRMDAHWVRRVATQSGRDYDDDAHAGPKYHSIEVDDGPAAATGGATRGEADGGPKDHSIDGEGVVGDDGRGEADSGLKRVGLDGYTDSSVIIPEETQDYELNVIGPDMKMSEIISLAGVDYLFDEVGLDAVELTADCDAQRRREIEHRFWRGDGDEEDENVDLGRRRDAGAVSCRERLVVDYSALRNFKGELLRGFPLVRRTAEEEHAFLIECSRLQLGEEWAFRRRKRAPFGDVFMPMLRAPRGQCPDGDSCSIRQRQLAQYEDYREQVRRSRRRRRFRRTRAVSERQLTTQQRQQLQHQSYHQVMERQQQQQQELQQQQPEAFQPERSLRETGAIPRRLLPRPVIVASSPQRGGFASLDGGNGDSGNGTASTSGLLGSKRGSFTAIFGANRSSFADRKTSSAVAGDSKDLPDVIETWEEDQHYPEPEEEDFSKNKNNNDKPNRS